MTARTRVLWDGYNLIPAPFLEISRETTFAGDGTVIGQVFNLTLTGTIVAFKGSPNSDGEFWTQSDYPPDEDIAPESRLRSILRKQEAIRKLFSVHGKQLEIQSGDGSAPLKCNPRINSINFAQDIWYDRCQYTITFETDILSVNGELFGEGDFDTYLKDVSETWAIDTQDDPENVDLPQIYSLSHSLSATGKLIYNEIGEVTKPAWERAKDWVLPRLGFNSLYSRASGVINIPAFYNAYNHVRSENIDVMNGQYSVTENWTMTSGFAQETFQVESTKEAQQGLTRVSINGEIKGLEIRDSDMRLTQSKYSSALITFNEVSGQILTRAQNYAGVNLNILPITFTVSRSPANGIISYSASYDNRPSNIVPEALFESISVNDSLQTDFPVPIFVIGRLRGPIIQNLGSSKETRRTLNMELVFDVNNFSGTLQERINLNPGLLYPSIQQIIDAARPIGNIVLLEENSKNWDFKNGVYSHNLTWIYE